MKFLKLPIFILLLSGCLCTTVKAQTDTTQIKITEETVETAPTDKNMKWVRIGEKRYDMDNVQSMFKVEMSPLYAIAELASSGGLGPFLSLGYEHKIPGTQWSAELKLSSFLSTRGSFGNVNSFSFNDDRSIQSFIERNVYAGLDVTVRYYPFKKKRMAEEKSGDNLWGLYGFVTVFNAVSYGEELKTDYNRDRVFQEPSRITRTTGFTTGDALTTFGGGYRKRFLNRAYFDVYLGLTTDLGLPVGDSIAPSVDFRLGYSIFKLKK